MTHSAADRRAGQRRRELNLLIASISKENQVTRPLALACECGHPSCLVSLPIGAPEFAALVSRGEPLLAPEHRHRAAALEPVEDEERELVGSRGRSHGPPAHQMSSPRVSTS
jgi:hypothetical protein